MNKILVIEDEKSIRFNILKLLQFENFDVIEAENGHIGIQLVKEQMPDLILCDIMMPELDGYGVRKILLQDSVTATIPFIFVTAKSEKTDFRLGMNLEADDYLTKPFTRDELIDTVSARLKKHATIDTQLQQKLNKLRGNITHSLPYELLIPLNQIQEFLQTLKNEYDLLERPKILELTNEAYISSLSLQRFSQNFLFYALLEITATDPQQINALRGKSISTTKRVISDVSIEKAKELGREADLYLELQDTGALILEANLAKIVEELIDNAFKFSRPGTPVRIESTINNKMFILCIIDEGQGMTAAQIANLGAYMQFERKLHEQVGSGLGFTIAKRLCELHGGELTISSIPQQKTIARVALQI